ncbi:MAG: Dps family protein [Thermonemataceae bacterium]
MENLIGIESNKAAALAEHLNDLLANYEIFYQNLRGFHWNITGNSFFELHAKFEELYNQANESIDEVAERILTLGHTPLHAFSDFMEKSEIKEAKNIKDAKGTVETTIQNLSTLISKERKILEVASDANDEGTVDLMTEYIQTQEKTTWMLSAYNK